MRQLIKESAIQMIKGNAIRLVMTLGALAIIALIGVYFSAQTEAIAAEEVEQHQESKAAHDAKFEFVIMNGRENRTDIDIITERMKQIHVAMNASLVRQEVRATRTEDKIDRILEKL